MWWVDLDGYRRRCWSSESAFVLTSEVNFSCHSLHTRLSSTTNKPCLDVRAIVTTMEATNKLEAAEKPAALSGGLAARVKQAPGGAELMKRYSEASNQIQAQFDDAVRDIKAKHDRTIKGVHAKYEAVDAKISKAQKAAGEQQLDA